MSSVCILKQLGKEGGIRKGELLVFVAGGISRQTKTDLNSPFYGSRVMSEDTTLHLSVEVDDSGVRVMRALKERAKNI